MQRIKGHTAIEVARTRGMTLSKFADPTEGAREGLSVGEARHVAAQDPSLIYLDLPKPTWPCGSCGRVPPEQCPACGASMGCCDEGEVHVFEDHECDWRRMDGPCTERAAGQAPGLSLFYCAQHMADHERRWDDR